MLREVIAIVCFLEASDSVVQHCLLSYLPLFVNNGSKTCLLYNFALSCYSMLCKQFVNTGI